MAEAAPAVEVPAAKPGLVVTTETLDIPVFTEQKEPKAEVPQGDQKTGAEAAPPGDKKPETTDGQPEKQGKNRFERRLDKAYRKAAEAQGRADFLEKQLAEAKAQQPQQQASSGAPRLEDFDDIKKYAEAFAKWNTETVLKQREDTQRTETAKATQARLSADWEAKAKLGEEKYDDFDEIVGDLEPTTPWAMAVMQAENAHDVAHYLGTHLEEAKRIIALDPMSQIREVGKIEARLLLQPPTPKASSKAPAPIAPVTGTSGGSRDIWDKDTDMKTFMKQRQKQVHGR